MTYLMNLYLHLVIYTEILLNPFYTLFFIFIFIFIRKKKPNEMEVVELQTWVANLVKINFSCWFYVFIFLIH